MKIEEELQTRKFNSEKHKAILSVLFTASWLSGRMNQALRPFGITEPQYNILRILNGSYPNPLSVLDIKSRMIDRMSNVSRLVEKLKVKGWVERENNAEDRRMVKVTITSTGKKILQEIQVIAPDETRFPESLTQKEAKELVRLLDKMRE